eukprot:3424217-Pyramimonas_sp.AAC.1
MISISLERALLKRQWGSKCREHSTLQGSFPAARVYETAGAPGGCLSMADGNGHRSRSPRSPAV